MFICTILLFVLFDSTGCGKGTYDVIIMFVYGWINATRPKIMLSLRHFHIFFCTCLYLVAHDYANIKIQLGVACDSKNSIMTRG